MQEFGGYYNFHEVDANGMNMLMRASAQGDIKTLEMLLALQLCPFQKDKLFGRTILHYAALNNKKEVLEYLVKRFPKLDPQFVNAEDYKGQTAVLYLAENDNWDLVKFMQTKMDANLMHQSSLDGMTIVHRACFNKNLAFVEKLIAQKLKVTELDKDSNTMLHWAASSGSEEIVQLLLDKKADIAAQNNIGNYALHCAAYAGHLAVCNLLVAGKKVNVNLENVKKLTPLHEAVSRGHVEIVQLLISKGAIVDCADRADVTPFELALYENQIDCGIALINAGANAVRTYKDGDDDQGYTTLLQYAIAKGFDKLVPVMVQASLTHLNTEDIHGRTPLHNAVLNKNITLVQVLTAKQECQRNAQEMNHQYTALMIACKQSDDLIVSWLLEHGGLELELVDDEHRTALHHAARKANAEIIASLLKAGSNIEAKNKMGRTPLHEACECNLPMNVELLLSKGANIEAIDAQGFTPLHLAGTP